jgi:hypothetical protein
VSTASARAKQLFNSSKNREQMATIALEAWTASLEARPNDAMTIKDVPVLKQQNPWTL